jgi:hypothetical protein
MESSFKKVRLVHFGFLVSVPLYVWVAERIHHGGTTAWTWWHWLAVGYSAFAVLGGNWACRPLLSRSEKILMSNPADAKAVKQWEGGQFGLWASAECVVLCGVVIRVALHGALWQACLFYVVGFLLLVLWAPRLPSWYRRG